MKLIETGFTKEQYELLMEAHDKRIELTKKALEEFKGEMTIDDLCKLSERVEAEMDRIYGVTETESETTISKAEAKVERLETAYYNAMEVLQQAQSELEEAKQELCKAIAELNELNADMTVEWEVN